MNGRPSLRILLVEDSRSDAAYVQRILADASLHGDYAFTTVPRLADAIALASTQSFDIALLDLNLADISGVATVSALHSALPRTPIIVYSGTDDPKLREQAALCGARSYLIKGRESGYAIKFMIEQSLAA